MVFNGSEESYAFPGDGEGPVRKIYVDKFSISKYSVTISEFKRFIDDEGDIFCIPSKHKNYMIDGFYSVKFIKND